MHTRLSVIGDHLERMDGLRRCVMTLVVTIFWNLRSLEERCHVAKRAFFIHLNLDDLAADTDALDSTEERGQWLEGFKVGSRGHEARDSWSDAKRRGHAFGVDCWENAEALRLAQSAKGIASGESRRNRTAVEPELNRSSTAVEPELNRTSTEPQPIQYPITNNQDLLSHETKNEKPKIGAKPIKPSLEIWTEEAKVKFPWWPLKDIQRVHDHYEANGWKQSNGNKIVDWRAAQRTCYRNFEKDHPRAEYDYKVSQVTPIPEPIQAPLFNGAIFGGINVA